MAITVTATQGGSTAASLALRVFVLTGAKSAGLQTGGSGSAQIGSTTAFTVAGTVQQSSSHIYGAAAIGNSSGATASNDTLVDNIGDATNSESYETFKQNAPSTGSQTYGVTAVSSSSGSVAWLEILAGGTLAEDASAPAVASGSGTATITQQTAAFTPPPGSLLVAIVSSDGGASQTTMTVSGGGLNWTEKVKANVTGNDYAGVWLADVPSAGALQPQQSIVWLRSHRQQQDSPQTPPPPPSPPQPQPQQSASWNYRHRQQLQDGQQAAVGGPVAITLTETAAAGEQLQVGKADEQKQQSIAWLRQNRQQQDMVQELPATLAEAAAAADTLTVAVAVSLADQAAAADTDQVSTAVEQPQQSIAWNQRNRQQQDAGFTVAFITLADQAAAGEVLSPAAAVTLADQAAAAETDVQAVIDQEQKQQSVTWLQQHRQQADAGAQGVTGTQIALAEQAAAAEQLIVTVAVPLAEQAAAADQLAVSTAVEQPQQSVSWLRQFRQQQDAGFTVAFIQLSDQAAAGETISPAVAATLGDQAAAGEAMAIAAALQVADEAAAGETLSAAAAVQLSDQAAAGEAVVVQTPFSIPLTEVAVVAEVLTVSRTASGSTGNQAWFAQAWPFRWAIPATTARWLEQPGLSRWRVLQPGPSRWAAQAASSRWRIIMSVFPPIAAVSLEDVNVEWTSALAGTKIDPTGQTSGQPLLSVNFAFPLSSGNLLRPAEPVAWFAGSWLQGGSAAFYVAQCLVGPNPGVVQLTAGQVYDVWCQILGSPEQPARFAGQLSVY